MKVIRAVSALAWGLLGLVFGFGSVFFGAQNNERPGGVLALCVGAAIMGAAYLMHRLTCLLLGKARRSAT